MSQLKTSALALALLVWPAITRAEIPKPDDAPLHPRAHGAQYVTAVQTIRL